jgi:hypothetical protein
VTLDGQRFSLVIDTGSSDTWVAATGFQCLDPNTYATLPTAQCGFGPFYNRAASTTFKSINHDFEVDYAGGEFLEGIMGTERFGIGGVSQGQTPYITINQTIGVVNDGYWTGDGISSGLMGLAYPALANGVNSQELNYTSVMYTLYVSPFPLLSQTHPLTPTPGSKTPPSAPSSAWPSIAHPPPSPAQAAFSPSAESPPSPTTAAGSRRP